MRNFPDKFVEKIKTHLYINNFFFFENHVVYESMWKNTAGQHTDENKTGRMCIACWIITATYTHSGCVKLIAYPRQQWLHQSAAILGYTYIACIV
jgi:hypothetical protein